MGTDSYAEADNLLRYAFEADWMRPTGKRFWLAETAVTHSAGTSVGNDDSLVFAPGALRAKMWLTYALGGEAVSFWLWRAHWAGQELEHGSVVYPWGDECANTREIRAVAVELAATCRLDANDTTEAGRGGPALRCAGSMAIRCQSHCRWFPI